MKAADRGEASPAAGPEGVICISKPQASSFDEEWYDIATESHFWLNWRFMAMMRQLERIGAGLQQGLKVLDIGCGCCVLSEQIEGATRWTVDGVDMNMEALSRARKGRGKKYYYDIFEGHEPFKNAYDIVILYDVLEHIDETGPFLKNALGHLRSGGLFLINVPALQSLHSQYDRAIGHIRRYNKKTLVREFDGLDTETLDVRYWGMSLVPLLIMRSVMMAIKKPDAETISRGFKPPSEFFNSLLKVVMRVEVALTTRPPVGTSVMLACRKL